MNLKRKRSPPKRKPDPSFRENAGDIEQVIGQAISSMPQSPQTFAP